MQIAVVVILIPSNTLIINGADLSFGETMTVEFGVSVGDKPLEVDVLLLETPTPPYEEIYARVLPDGESLLRDVDYDKPVPTIKITIDTDKRTLWHEQYRRKK